MSKDAVTISPIKLRPEEHSEGGYVRVDSPTDTAAQFVVEEFVSSCSCRVWIAEITSK